MRSPAASPPSATATASSSSFGSSQTFWHWDSPLPYLFVGLGLMILLISAALVILACSFRKRSSSSTHDAEKVAQPAAAVADNTPKIVVIMAGDDNPTHLAIPIPCASFSTSNTCVCNKILQNY